MIAQILTRKKCQTLGKAAQFFIMITLALALIGLRLPQLITGTLVNALLILAVEQFGLGPAVLLGIITPMAAAFSGLLPLPLLVMVPFISLANGLFVSLYNIVRRTNIVLALSSAALFKFGFLLAVISWFLAHPLTVLVAGRAELVDLPLIIVNMMRWPQLLTALLGGGLAWFSLSIFKKPD